MRALIRVRNAIRLVACLCSLILAYSQQPFEVNQPNLVFSVPADKPVAPGTEQSFLLSPGPGLDHVPFEFSFAYVSGGKSPNFIVLTPASGVAPVRVAVSLNPNIVPYMKNGVYNLDITIKSTDPLNPGALGGNIGLLLYGPPAPTITSIVNAASQQPLLSPGEIISIYGTNFGNLPLSSNCPSTVNPAGQAASTTTVTIYDIPAPILYVSPTQINAVVP